MGAKRRWAVRKTYRGCKALDLKLKRFTKRVAKLFMHSKFGQFVRELVEPLTAGFVLGACLLLVDVFRTRKNAPALFDTTVSGAVEHARPDVLWLAILLLGLYFLLAGSVLANGVRRLTVLPLAKLSSHASMLALGVFWVLAIREGVTTSHAIARPVTEASASLFIVGAFARALATEFEPDLYDRLTQRFQSARLFALACGIALVAVGLVGINLTANQDAEEAAKRNRLATPTDAPKADAALPAPERAGSSSAQATATPEVHLSPSPGAASAAKSPKPAGSEGTGVTTSLRQ